MTGQRAVLLDTCVLINLIATGHLEDIVSRSDDEFIICSAVADESIFLRQVDVQAQPELVQIQSLVQSGHLRVYHPENDEEESLYVSYATELEDGEAMSLALAQLRGLVMATDDKKARRLFLEAVDDSSRLLSTAAILRKWAERGRVPPATLAAILKGVNTRARFFPSQTDPDYQWWCDCLTHEK